MLQKPAMNLMGMIFCSSLYEESHRDPVKLTLDFRRVQPINARLMFFSQLLKKKKSGQGPMCSFTTAPSSSNLRQPFQII